MMPKIPKFGSPRNFDEPVLKEAKRRQNDYKALLSGNRDGSIPVKKTFKQLVAEDEKQLDLLQSQRRKIFKSVRQSQPMSTQLKRQLMPGAPPERMSPLESPLMVRSVDSNDYKKQDDSIIQGSVSMSGDYGLDSIEKPVH